jgi:hypothetical protein
VPPIRFFVTPVKVDERRFQQETALDTPGGRAFVCDNEVVRNTSPEIPGGNSRCRRNQDTPALPGDSYWEI